MGHNLSRRITAILLILIVHCQFALGWSKEGHRLTAMIAAQHLTDSARQRVFDILKDDVQAGPLLADRDANDISALADAMAEVASWADSIKHEGIGAGTASWHFVDLAASDQLSDIPERCDGGNCLTARMVSLSASLKSGAPVSGHPGFGTLEELKFLIHFYGDLHQPLHCATDADGGGNCLKTTGFGDSELHAVLDDGLVNELMKDDHGHKLTELEVVQGLNKQFGKKFKSWTKLSDPEKIALESHQVAFDKLYGPIFASGEFFESTPEPFKKVTVPSCEGAPEGFLKMQPIDVTSIFDDQTVDVVAQQITKGGFRLAAFLNKTFAN
jgi:hypothetical protein